ncbi:MAG: hypothetical protein Rhims3KO_14300 [Hyphomicrobiales bacterium]
MFTALLCLVSLLCAGSAASAQDVSAPWFTPGDAAFSTPLSDSVVFGRLRSPQLDRAMDYYVYLPPGFGVDDWRRYPVVYMHDGGELFRAGRMGAVWPEDDRSVLPPSWDLETVLDGYFADHPNDAAIIVAVDTTQRVEHFSPWPWTPANDAHGRAYIDFIIHTLKPNMDAHFPTVAGRHATAMLGSSLGGIITAYALVKYPEVIASAAALSPVLTDNVLGEELNRYAALRGPLEPVRLYMDMGVGESPRMHAALQRFSETLVDRGFDVDAVRVALIEDGTHRPESWRQRLPDALAFLLQDADQP